MFDHPSTTARRSALPKALLASAALLLALAACKPVDSQTVTGSTLPDDYRVTHPISIEEAVDTMDVPVGMNSQHLTSGMRANVQGFGLKFLNSRSAVIAIVVPRGSANARVAGWLANEIQDVLVGAGVSAKSIEIRGYRANKAEASAPIRIAYARIAAKTASCGPWQQSMMAAKDNVNYEAYGCASQQNLAAMVDNPLDLLYPRAMTPADTTRRVGVLDKYRAAAPVQGDYSKETGGAIVQGVGN